MYKQYKINGGDTFRQESYPDVVDELEELGRNTTRMSGDFKSEIIISFLKDHSLNIHWIAKNPKLSKFMTSREVSTSHLESLFDSCRSNDAFLSEFEAFIKRELR